MRFKGKRTIDVSIEELKEMIADVINGNDEFDVTIEEDQIKLEPIIHQTGPEMSPSNTFSGLKVTVTPDD